MLAGSPSSRLDFRTETPWGPPITRHPFPSPQPSWPPGGPFHVVRCLSGTSHPLLTPTSILLHQTQLLPICHHPSTAATSPRKSERLALLLEPLPHGPPCAHPGSPAALPPLQTCLRLCGRLTPRPRGHDGEPVATLTSAGTVLATRRGLTGAGGCRVDGGPRTAQRSASLPSVCLTLPCGLSYPPQPHGPRVSHSCLSGTQRGRCLGRRWLQGRKKRKFVATKAPHLPWEDHH